MSLPSAPRRVLIADRVGTAVAALIMAARDDLELRVRTLDAVTPEDVAWCECFVGFRPPAGGLPGVPWIHGTGAGVDALVASPGLGPEVLVTRTIGALGPRMAEYCLGRALAITQNLAAIEAARQAGRWDPSIAVSSLSGCRAVVVGTGAMGSPIAALFRAAGARVTGVSRSGAASPAFEEVVRTAALHDVLESAAWVVLAAPLTPETRHLLDADALARCRGAVLINVARGALIDEGAIVPALDAGSLAWACLDVFEREPLDPASSLWRHPRVMLSPHVAALTTEEDAASSFLAALEALEQGGVPDLVVDPARGY